MKSLVLGLRALLFYLGYVPLIGWFGGTGLLFFYFLPYPIRSAYILTWNRCAVHWLKWTCGVKFQVIGAENLPAAPYVALCKHKSQWETYFLQYYLRPVSIILKRELLRLPFFGWGLLLTKPIAIDRDNPKQALKQTLEQGQARLAENISILVFPEGTRKSTARDPKYARGGANIAVASGVPVVPIAHNAGEFWPADKFIKYPGTITVKIGEPIDSSTNNSREITEMAKQWIETEVAAMEKRC